MNTETTSAHAAALSFIKSHETGVLSTLSMAGTPRARTLYYVSSEDFSIYFLTLINTRKAEDMRHHHEVAFTVSDTSVPQTLQIEGLVEDVSNIPVSDTIVHGIFERLKSNATYHAPLARFDAAEVKFFRITPTWIRWGDFTSGTHTDEILFDLTKDTHESNSGAI
jgi:uncharacterized pyridoxamine 5'-phosphate oxidase family protein